MIHNGYIPHYQGPVDDASAAGLNPSETRFTTRPGSRPTDPPKHPTRTGPIGVSGGMGSGIRNKAGWFTERLGSCIG